jgi:hypothetical protein
MLLVQVVVVGRSNLDVWRLFLGPCRVGLKIEAEAAVAQTRENEPLIFPAAGFQMLLAFSG